MRINLNKTIKTVFSMFFLSAGCKALGFLRQMLLANYFGTGDVVDAYVMAQSIPNILFGGILVAFGASYMPLFSKRYEKEGLQAANDYTSRILTILFILSTVVAIIGITFSDQITSIMASGLNEKAKRITSSYVKYTFGYTYFAASAGIYSSYLQYKGIFTKQIVGDYIQNFFFISFIWIANKFGDRYLIWGLFLGYVFRVIYLRILVQKNQFRLRVQFSGINENLKEIKKYAVPIFLATTANEINAFVDKTLASRLDRGSISALNYAHQLSTVFMELTITILATVIFPKLVQTYTRKEIGVYKNYVKRGIVLCSLISFPLTFMCASFSRQIIELIFERGVFVSESTIKTGGAFLYYSIGIVSLAICTYMGKVYYSAGDMKTPMICATIGVAVNILCDIILVNLIQEKGLALATSLASVVNSILLIVLYQKQRIKLFEKKILLEICKIISASFAMIIVGLLLNTIAAKLNPDVRKICFVGICVICAFTYVGMIMILNVKEFKMLIKRESNEE